MKRKVNRVGQNTLTVSLPSKWAKDYGLAPGSEVEVLEEDNKLCILVGKPEKKLKKASISLDDLSKTMINRYLFEFYLEGLQEIELNFTKEYIEDHKNNKKVPILGYINDIIKRFIGVEVVSQTKNRVVLQNLMGSEEVQKIEVVQRRVFFLIKEFIDEMVSSMDSGYHEFHIKSYGYHDNISKFIYSYLRLLNQSDLDISKKRRLFSLFLVIDKMVDKLRHTSERLDEMKKITPKTKKSVKLILDHFLRHFDFIFKKDFSVKDFEMLFKEHYALRGSILSQKMTDEERKVIAECNIMFDIITDFSETYISLNMERYLA